MIYKKLLFVYIFIFISLMLAVVFYLPDSVVIFKNMCAIILMTSLLGIEYAKNGFGTSFIIYLMIVLAWDIGILIGIQTNENINFFVNSALASSAGIVLVATFKTIRKHTRIQQDEN